MKWWQRINTVLNNEPETWLAYLYGQQFDELEHLHDRTERYHGKFYRLMIHVYRLLLRTKLRFSPRTGAATYLIYVGTLNQKLALESTFMSLRKRHQQVVAVASASVLAADNTNSEDYSIASLGLIEFFQVLILTTVRFRRLTLRVGAVHPKLVTTRLNAFLGAYTDLVYFDRLLTQVNPKFVIVSNDHNTANRTLLALARRQGCKTAYLQHASVSALFPALNVDYAFLDGMSAYQIYLKCEHNISHRSNLLSNRKVILSGQKKKLTLATKSVGIATVGVAINTLDKIDDLARLVKALRERDVQLLVRWHPGFSSQAVEELKVSLDSYDIDYSDPRNEKVDGFLIRIAAIVAGNSSIHLEAVLSGVPSFYYEITPTERFDYYGYVKNGIARHAISLIQLIELLDQAVKGNVPIDPENVRYFSASYGTEWEGKEGELVAESLLTLDKGLEVSSALGVLEFPAS